MKYLVVAFLFAFTEGGVITSKTSTHCVTIRNVNYEKEILLTVACSPYQLAIHHDTNTLFYSYTARLDEMFKIATLSLKIGTKGLVSGIHNGFANAVNHRGNIIYMGGEDGIYEFDKELKTAKNLHIKDENIWQMFYKDGLYFTTYPDEKAFLYKQNVVVEVPEVKDIKVLLIAVSKENNLVYTNSSGVFLYSKANKNAIRLTDAVANGITADIDGDLYFSTPTGLFYINEETNSVEELVTLNNIYGMAVESDGNIIYATEDEIVRLKPTKKDCFADKTALTLNDVN